MDTWQPPLSLAPAPCPLPRPEATGMCLRNVGQVNVREKMRKFEGLVEPGDGAGLGKGLMQQELGFCGLVCQTLCIWLGIRGILKSHGRFIPTSPGCFGKSCLWCSHCHSLCRTLALFSSRECQVKLLPPNMISRCQA